MMTSGDHNVPGQQRQDRQAVHQTHGNGQGGGVRPVPPSPAPPGPRSRPPGHSNGHTGHTHPATVSPAATVIDKLHNLDLGKY